MSKPIASLEQLHDFDQLIDARSPAEYADDHIPLALSCPVLNDAQRAEVGTLYKQVSPFSARKLGAVLVSRNIADHLATHFSDRPKTWRPLVYCWRGGQRSGAFTHILREIGWNAARLDGGYRTWRRHVIERLEVLPQDLDFRVIGGATGSGKSKILEALAAAGEQVLHLEQIAAHKGSVLGSLPGVAQPSQRGFESSLCATLQQFTSKRPVYVEAESRKIGALHVPEQLIERIRAGTCFRVSAPLGARVKFLLDDYDHALANHEWLRERLNHLRGLHSSETLARWNEFITHGHFARLVEELLIQHYDALYKRSQANNFVAITSAKDLTIDEISAAGITALAERIAKQ